MNNVKNVSIIGGGWRTEGWINVINRLDNLKIKKVYCRNKDKANNIKSKFNVEVLENYKEIYVDIPDLVIVCTAKKDNLEISCELIERGLNVFTETPLEIPKEYITRIKNSKGILRVAEQYRYQPRFQVAKRIIESGILGNVHTVELSCCHEYHAMSLLRFLLNVLNQLPDKINTISFKDQYIETHFRYGEIPHELKNNNRTLSIMKFKDKLAIYDFEDGQYFSSIRTQHYKVKGDRGEYIDGNGSYIDKDGNLCTIKCEEQYTGTKGSLYNLDFVGINCNGKEIYHNKYFGKCMSEEQIAMAQNLEDMFNLLDNKKEFYPLEYSDIDAKIARMIKEETKTI